MKSKAAWKYLIPIFSAFWLVFAFFLIVAQFPFYIISLAAHHCTWAIDSGDCAGLGVYEWVVRM